MWNELTTTQKSDLMQLFLRNGISNLDEMKRMYDEASNSVNAQSNQYALGDQMIMKKPKVTLSDTEKRWLQLYDQKWGGTEYDTPEWRQFWYNLVQKESSFNPNIRGVPTPYGRANGWFQIMDAYKTYKDEPGQFDNAKSMMDSNIAYFNKHLTAKDRELMKKKGMTMYDLYSSAWFSGPKGALNYLRTGKNAKDANGFSVSEYIGAVRGNGSTPPAISSSPQEVVSTSPKEQEPWEVVVNDFKEVPEYVGEYFQNQPERTPLPPEPKNFEQERQKFEEQWKLEHPEKPSTKWLASLMNIPQVFQRQQMQVPKEILPDFKLFTKYLQPSNTFDWGGYKTKNVNGRELTLGTIPNTGEQRWIDLNDYKDFNGKTGYKSYDDEGNELNYIQFQDAPNEFPVQSLDEVTVIGDKNKAPHFNQAGTADLPLERRLELQRQVEMENMMNNSTPIDWQRMQMRQTRGLDSPYGAIHQGPTTWDKDFRNGYQKLSQEPGVADSIDDVMFWTLAAPSALFALPELAAVGEAAFATPIGQMAVETLSNPWVQAGLNSYFGAGAYQHMKNGGLDNFINSWKDFYNDPNIYTGGNALGNTVQTGMEALMLAPALSPVLKGGKTLAKDAYDAALLLAAENGVKGAAGRYIGRQLGRNVAETTLSGTPRYAYSSEAPFAEDYDSNGSFGNSTRQLRNLKGKTIDALRQMGSQAKDAFINSQTYKTLSTFKGSFRKNRKNDMNPSVPIYQNDPAMDVYSPSFGRSLLLGKSSGTRNWTTDEYIDHIAQLKQDAQGYSYYEIRPEYRKYCSYYGNDKDITFNVTGRTGPDIDELIPMRKNGLPVVINESDPHLKQLMGREKRTTVLPVVAPPKSDWKNYNEVYDSYVKVVMDDWNSNGPLRKHLERSGVTPQQLIDSFMTPEEAFQTIGDEEQRAYIGEIIKDMMNNKSYDLSDFIRKEFATNLSDQIYWYSGKAGSLDNTQLHKMNFNLLGNVVDDAVRQLTKVYKGTGVTKEELQKMVQTAFLESAKNYATNDPNFAKQFYTQFTNNYNNAFSWGYNNKIFLGGFKKRKQFKKFLNKILSHEFAHSEDMEEEVTPFSSFDYGIETSGQNTLAASAQSELYNRAFDRDVMKALHIDDYFAHTGSAEKGGTEMAARGTQIKDLLGLKKGESITEEQLRKIARYWMLPKWLGGYGEINNNMYEFFKSIKDWKAAAEWISIHSKKYGGPLTKATNVFNLGGPKDPPNKGLLSIGDEFTDIETGEARKVNGYTTGYYNGIPYNVPVADNGEIYMSNLWLPEIEVSGNYSYPAEDMDRVFADMLTLGTVSQNERGVNKLQNANNWKDYVEGTLDVLSPAMFGKGALGNLYRGTFGAYGLYEDIPQTFNDFKNGDYWKGALDLGKTALDAALTYSGGKGFYNDALWAANDYGNQAMRSFARPRIVADAIASDVGRARMPLMSWGQAAAEDANTANNMYRSRLYRASAPPSAPSSSASPPVTIVYDSYGYPVSNEVVPYTDTIMKPKNDWGGWEDYRQQHYDRIMEDWNNHGPLRSHLERSGIVNPEIALDYIMSPSDLARIIETELPDSYNFAKNNFVGTYAASSQSSAEHYFSELLKNVEKEFGFSVGLDEKALASKAVTKSDMGVGIDAIKDAIVKKLRMQGLDFLEAFDTVHGIREYNGRIIDFSDIQKNLNSAVFDADKEFNKSFFKHLYTDPNEYGDPMSAMAAAHEYGLVHIPLASSPSQYGVTLSHELGHLEDLIKGAKYGIVESSQNAFAPSMGSSLFSEAFDLNRLNSGTYSYFTGDYAMHPGFITEMIQRATQIKDFERLLKGQSLTGSRLKQIATEYFKKGNFDNNMSEFFSCIKDWDKAAEWISTFGKALIPSAVGAGTAYGLSQGNNSNIQALGGPLVQMANRFDDGGWTIDLPEVVVTGKRRPKGDIRDYIHLVEQPATMFPIQDHPQEVVSPQTLLNIMEMSKLVDAINNGTYQVGTDYQGITTPYMNSTSRFYQDLKDSIGDVGLQVAKSLVPMGVNTQVKRSYNKR